MIDVDNLRVDRNGKTICSVPRLTIEPRERVGIYGTNGSGKSTLLRVLADLERNFAGKCHIEVDRRDRVYVDQYPFLFRGTVLSNVAYGLRAHGLGRRPAQVKAMHWLDKLGIRGLAGSKSHHLSGGERRRAALARAMALGTKLLLLDEPLAEIDSQGAECVRQVLAEMSDATILLASPMPLPQGFTTRDYRLD